METHQCLTGQFPPYKSTAWQVRKHRRNATLVCDLGLGRPTEPTGRPFWSQPLSSQPDLLPTVAGRVASELLGGRGRHNPNGSPCPAPPLQSPLGAREHVQLLPLQVDGRRGPSRAWAQFLGPVFGMLLLFVFSYARRRPRGHVIKEGGRSRAPVWGRWAQAGMAWGLHLRIPSPSNLEEQTKTKRGLKSAGQGRTSGSATVEPISNCT